MATTGCIFLVFLQTWRWSVLANINSTKINFVNELERRAQHISPPYFPWDPYAACYLINLKFIKAEVNAIITIEYKDESKVGAVSILYPNSNVDKNVNVHIVTKVNTEVFKEVQENVLS